MVDVEMGIFLPAQFLHGKLVGVTQLMQAVALPCLTTHISPGSICRPQMLHPHAA